MLYLLLFMGCLLYVKGGIPVPDERYKVFIISGDIYRYSIDLSRKTFIDEEDGNASTLQLQWMFTNNQLVPDSYWIVLKRSKNKDELIFYLDRSVWSNKNYYFNLKAIDKDGNSAVKFYNFTLISPPQEPIYKRLLILESSTSEIFQKTNVEILFYIQEQKLFPYSQLNLQGIPLIGSFMTEYLNITKENDVTTIVLLWSSSIFVLNFCSITKIINFRSKTVKGFNAKYKQYFNPEFIVKNSTEYFSSFCAYLSNDAPKVSEVLLNPIQVDLGVYFSYLIPSDLFLAPETGKLMSLSFDLRTSSGEKLPSFYWVLLNKNISTNELILEGFISVYLAIQQNNFTFQLIASTPLLEESYRILTININYFQKLEENFVVLFNGLLTSSILYTRFVNKFIAVLSNYLSFNSSVIIFNVDFSSGQVNVKWSLNEFTSKVCDFMNLELLKSKTVDESGLPLNMLKNIFIENMNYSIVNITFIEKLACYIDKNGPVRNEALHTYKIQDVFHFTILLPNTTFVDAKDGYMNNLRLELLLPNGDNVPINNWVQLLRSKDKDSLIGFLTLETISKKNWYFTLKATDSDGNYATKSFNFLLEFDRFITNYLISITLQTSLAEIITMNDVQLVFFILEHKLLSYSILQKQGISVMDMLVVLELNVTREVSKLITVRLLWSSKIFSSSSCEINKIVRYRTKVFEDFKDIYTDFFLPQFILLSNIEYFVDSCSYLSSDPPIVTNTSFTKVDVIFGLPFSVNIPNDIFRPPDDGSGMNLTVYLKGDDGKMLPDTYWVSLNDNSFSNNLRLVGYPLYDSIAIQKTFNFQLIAYTSLLINASRSFALNVINFFKIQENFVVTLSIVTHNIISYFTYINNFLSAVSSYLIYPVESVLILDLNYSSKNLVIRWTLKEYTTQECNFQGLNFIISKLIYENGQPNVNFSSSLNKIIYNLSSVTIEKINACNTNKNGPVPDKPEMNITLTNTQYRFNLLLKQTTFVDSKDGDMSNLDINLLLENEEPVPLNYWVQIDRNNGSDNLIGYIDWNLNKQMKKVILRATDSDGNYANKFYNFYFDFLPNQATYKMLLTLHSNTESFLEKTDVQILFYIQEIKLLNYSLINTQGMTQIDSIMTEEFKVLRNNDAITITLLWSYTGFISLYCQLEKILQFREKNHGKYYTTYYNMFLPEFSMIRNTEIFSGACSYLSADPPMLGTQQFDKIEIDSGTSFSVAVPHDVFRSPLSGSTMLLKLELRKNGERSTLPWIELNGNIYQNGVRVEGYMPYEFSLKQSVFIFELVAITPLLEEIFSLFNVTITDSRKLQLNFVVTFSSQLHITNYIFVSSFISKLSSYLAVRLSSIIVIKLENTSSSTNIQWTLLSLTSSYCDDELIQTMTLKLKNNDATLNPNLIFALIKMNFLVTNITFSLGFACNIDSKPPIPDNKTEDILIQTNMYRFKIGLPVTTFVDVKDGNMNGLKIEFLTDKNSTVTTNSWVQLQKINNSYAFIGYVNILVLKSNIWTYYVRATDSAGNVALKRYNFIMVGKQTQANYKKNLTIRSFAPMFFEKSNIEILFYIQEQKLYPYSLQQNQGLPDIATIITDTLEVTYTDSLILIHLVWTSAIFISKICDIQGLASFRSKTLGDFEHLYKNSFLPEMVFISETEEFLNACKFLTNKPPLIGPSTVSNITVKFGEFFSEILPNDIFTPPSLETSLSIYLRDEEGKALPSYYWISLSSTNLFGLKIEGYVSVEFAIKKSNFTFRLVAATPLQVEAYRFLNIIIKGYKPVQQNFIVNFKILATFSSLPSFINQFVFSMSDYLSYSPSSMLIISSETVFPLTNIKWTMVQFTNAYCDSSLTSLITQKLLDLNGQVNSDLISLLSTKNIVLLSNDILSTNSCTIDTDGPVPDQPFQEFNFNSSVYRFSIILPLSTFIDKKDGVMNKLSVELTTENGLSVFVDNWVELVQSGSSFRLNGYISNKTYYKSQWSYLLKATDSDKNVGIKKYIFNLLSSFKAPHYKRSLTLRSFSSAITSNKDVSILFFIQEKKLIPFSLGQNQGILDVNFLITENLLVIRSESYMTIKLVWSSTLFLSDKCFLQGILNLRSKTIGEYSYVYTNMFQPEFMLVEENESFSGACSHLSFDPPLIGSGILNLFELKFGEFFSIVLPNNLFTSPSTELSLSVYLRDKNGNNLSEYYWITLSSTSLLPGLRLEGYVSSMIASQNTSYTFRLVAVTSLLVDAYRFLNVKIQGYNPVQENVVITFTLLLTIRSLPTFINMFVSTLSSYLSYSPSSLLIIKYNTTASQTSIYWTLLEFTNTDCDVSSASVLKLKLLDANNKIRTDLLIALTSINGNLKSIDFFFADSCSIDRKGPVPDQKLQEYTFTNNIYRFSIPLPDFTFVDEKDGDTSKLVLELITENGLIVPIDSWIELVYSGNRYFLNGFISRKSYAKSQWVYFLKATDSDNNIGIKNYIFNLIPPPQVSFYKRSLTLQSFASSIIGLKDVSVLFFIQEKKLIPYSKRQNQGILDVDLLVTDSFQIIRSKNYITINLVWSSSLFVSTQCFLQRIINFRSKTIGEYKTLYNQLFQPEFIFVEDKESFYDVCSNLSVDPPLLGGETLNAVAVKFGEYFSINLPNELFISPSIGTSLELYLRDANGNSLPDKYWIAMTTSPNLRIEGYATNMVATQNTNYIFRLVAVTSLQVESYRLLNVVIQGYKPIQQNILITFTILSPINFSPAFINQFVLAISNYISYLPSSILLISYETSFLVSKLLWTLVEFTNSNCDVSSTASVKLKLIDVNGEVNPNLTRFLANINIVLKSVDVLYSDICAIDKNGPVPDQLSQEFTFSSNVYRFSIYVPNSTFVDEKDGGMNNLGVELTNEDGTPVTLNSWIDLVNSGSNFRLNGYINSICYVKHRWIYFLKATDSNKNFGVKKYIFNIKSPPAAPSYKRSLTLRSFYSNIISMSDVLILFFIQEKKLIPYFSAQNQDNDVLEVESIITDSLLVTRSSKYVTVKLVWSSTQFVSTQCSLQRIINLRSKTVGFYSAMYNRMYQNEFLLLEDKEIFDFSCSTLSSNPPLVGPASLNAIEVKFGVFFSVLLPNNLFTSPSIGTSLSVYLRDENGNVLPDFYWVTLSSNGLIGLKIEGYASNVIALQKTSYSFRLIAVSSLQVEAYRLIDIKIQGYKPIQENFIITFTIMSTAKSFTSFINQFVFEISKYLSYTSSSVLIISYEINFSLTTIKWTIIDFTNANCNSSFASLITLKILKNANGEVNPNLVSVLANINVFLISANISSSYICSIIRDGPVPDQLLQEYTFTNNVYHFSLSLPLSTFIDDKDGDMSKLLVELTTESGQSVSVESWIELVQSEGSFRIIGYINSKSYARTQWVYCLKATDSDKNIGIKKYIFNLLLPPLSPYYKRSLTLHSTSSVMLSMKDVSILFFIQEKKLLPYSIKQSQGILELDSLITESLQVIRSSDIITVNLVWSSTIFVSDQCSLPKIVNFRSKTIGIYRAIYSQMFEPEFNFVEENESFLA
ncbi:uncharacterized protein LOC105845485 isoform X1 [Hydra vulgaris]|uniref:uncharacterized protein LOC105845485 isoform X1 n=1 Tax=Hydra vulgaris TaxID=6087 RepID=UPI001F5EAC66|nr:uncharacterized protein LOC105845485 [Hydra vulgaris]